MQTGLECIGNLTTLDVAEVVLLAAKSLSKLGENFVLDISHMGLVAGILEKSGLSHEGKNRALMYLHQKNSHELRRLCEAENCGSEALLVLVQAVGTPSAVFEKLRKYTQEENLLVSLVQLQQICGVLESFGFGENIRVDFSVGTDMKYYSGVVFKGYIEGIPVGVLSGGQYDKLMDNMNRTSRAIGFAVYMDYLGKLSKFDGEEVVIRG
jgi:ATP phosphoribosyltransferase regulatory subunit